MNSRVSRAGLVAAAVPVGCLVYLGAIEPRSRPSEPAIVVDRSTIGFDSEPIQPLEAPTSLDASKVRLGRMLFHDRRLSGDNTVSCASCHDLKNGGVDGLPTATGIKHQHLKRNSPTVYNCSFNFRQFWDGRAATLEEQVDGPVGSPAEMGDNWRDVEAKLNADPKLVKDFSKTYPDGIRRENVRNAIATFERSLVTPDSRFDKYLSGDRAAITPFEREGYELFKSIGCVACHQGRLLGGNMMQPFGAVDPNAARSHTAAGNKAEATESDSTAEAMRLFKVPGLRNVERTGPYFHDGSARTLKEAIQIMGSIQLGKQLEQDEIEKLNAFLITLTGTFEGKPL